MKRIRGIFSLLLTLIILSVSATPAFASVQNTGFSDVSPDVWYAQAVAYVQNNGIMSGTTSTTFEPTAPMSRGMLATVLYRIAKKPAVSDSKTFVDVADNMWYSDAVQWASTENIITGYGNGRFGINDAVSREQLATILWRYAGSPVADADEATFNDLSAVSNWAIPAVNWVKTNNIMNGRGDNRFDPAGKSTRAEVATILYNYLSPATTPENAAKALVVYFSLPETTDPNNMTQEEANSTVVIDGKVLGNTQYVAQLIQDNTGADIFRIEPRTPYPTNHTILVDLARKEQDENARPELASRIENLAQYDVIFLGYPNWWGDMPMVLYSFLESHDLSGKTVIPFNTHGGSGFSSTINSITQLQPNATVNRNGFTVSRNNVQDCTDDVAAWVQGLGLQKK
ncbi:flavodoxin [Clostridium sp. KNHs205]|uniref:flavodoxin n=1 Tax=Clostridium sp. KNHs205 TaxID=1449050 RepID=UPI0009DDBFC2|nr:flavodoxin [Clostridium sp. KNHs205]